MPRKKHAANYGEGTWFAVPLRKKGPYAVGVVARGSARTQLFGYFFGPILKAVPTLAQLGQLRARGATLRGIFSDVGLADGEWPIIGKVAHWNRAHWPLPPFVIVDDEEDAARMIVYSDDLKKMLSYQRCDPKLA